MIFYKVIINFTVDNFSIQSEKIRWTSKWKWFNFILLLNRSDFPKSNHKVFKETSSRFDEVFSDVEVEE